MKRSNFVGLICLSAVVTAAGGVHTFAQGGGPGRGGHGGPGRGPGRGGPASLVRTPLPVLTASLKLSADQKTAIQKIQADFRTQADALRPAPPADNGGGPPDRQTMDANRAKMQQLEKTADASILADLTDDQKTAAANLLKLMPVLREAGIPAEVLGDLNLTAAQTAKIVATVKADKEAANGDMGKALHDKIHTDVMALLSQDQQSVVTAYLQAHPHPQGGPDGMGGPRGPGGRGGGRHSGPGGPDGGPGDMPPPPQEGGQEGGPDGMPPGPPPPDGGNI